VYDARTGDKVYVGHAPEHLLYVAESIEEVMVMAAKLCMRPNDTLKGRNIKLTHYIDLHKRFYGKLPDDLPAFIRHELDIPIIYKQEILEAFKEQGISVAERAIPDPTLLERLVRARKR
jgi:acetyl-CoA decarbonylase/synthase complex subunit alpha